MEDKTEKGVYGHNKATGKLNEDSDQRPSPDDSAHKGPVVNKAPGSQESPKPERHAPGSDSEPS